jgi:hypothetical protein
MQCKSKGFPAVQFILFLSGLWRFPRLLGSVHIVGWLCMDLEIL